MFAQGDAKKRKDYSTRLDRGRHGCDTAMYTQNDTPWAAADPGRSLISTIALLYTGRNKVTK